MFKFLKRVLVFIRFLPAGNTTSLWVLELLRISEKMARKKKKKRSHFTKAIQYLENLPTIRQLWCIAEVDSNVTSDDNAEEEYIKWVEKLANQ